MVEKCPCDCKSLSEFTLEEARKVIDYLGVDVGVLHGWDPDQLKGMSPEAVEDLTFDSSKVLAEGMNEEREHCDITHGDAVLTAKIALAHLKEDPEYYEKLKKAGL